MVRRESTKEKSVSRTLALALRWLWDLEDNVGLSVRGADLVGMGARDFAVSGLIVYLFDYSLGDRCASGCKRSVADAHPRCAPAAGAVWDYFYFVWDSVLCALLISVSARNLAIARFVVHSLHSGHRNG